MTNIKEIKGAIFDLDGTILDSMFIWNKVGYKFIESKNIQVPPDADKDFIKLSLTEAAEYYIKHFDNSATVEGIVADINKLVENFYFNEVVKKDGIAEFLDFLKKRGVKMCVATATDRYLVEKALARNGLLDYFSEIFTCNGVGSGKTTPVIYEKSLEHLGTAKDKTFIFEDALYAIETANKAGFNIVGIHDVSEKASKAEVAKLCDYYIEKYSDIYKYFE